MTVYFLIPARGLSSPTFVVPGVTDLGNMRPKVKVSKPKEVSMPLDQPVMDSHDPQGSIVSTAFTTDVSVK